MWEVLSSVSKERGAFGARRRRLKPAIGLYRSGVLTKSREPEEVTFCLGPKVNLLKSPRCMRKQQWGGGRRIGLGSELMRASCLTP